MDVLADLFIRVVTFIFEVTVQALVFVFHLLMSIFSPRYREKLKNDWNTSGLNRFYIIFGVTLYSIALIIALTIWIPLICCKENSSISNEAESSVEIQFSKGEIGEMKKTKGLDKLIDVTGGFIKRNIEGRKQKQDETEKL